jgi:hypothetical protein
MNGLCCPGCHLRFPRSAAHISACPQCGLPPASVSGPASLMGYRLFDPLDQPHSLPEALAVSLPLPMFSGPGSYLDLGHD